MHSNFLKILRGKPIQTIYDALALIPREVSDALSMVDEAIADVIALKKEILSFAPENRTYANTVAAYDEMTGLVFVASSMAGIVKQVSADIHMRAAPHCKIQQESIKICKDAALYKAFCEYRDYGMSRETLSSEQQYFFKKAMADFKRSGYDKGADAFAHLSHLEEEMQQACSAFDSTLDNDVTSVAFLEEELTGITPEFIAAQHRDEQGRVVLLCNRTTLSAILPHCSNEMVRRTFKKAYERRAFPANADNLQRMLALRHEYAVALGYENYAAYALAGYMMETPAQVHDFLDTYFARIRPLAERDFANIISTLPDDVVLVDGKLQSWDVPYAVATYEKIHSELDQRQIAHYFPVDKAVAGIFAIYEKFMGLSFDYHATIDGAWHESIQGITVYTKDRSRVLGYIFLDLYPRPQKYSHACCWEVTPRVLRHDVHSGMLYEVPSVSVIIANFPKPHGDRPALFLHSDITTFFHEFGHAIHNVLSCTSHTQTSGSMGVMLDFVELPSQIMEEWMWRSDMLRLVSGHYQTGEPLPDEIIQKMVAARTSGRSFFEMNQVYYSNVSLALHERSIPVDLDGLLHEMYTTYMQGLVWDEGNKFYTSFGHLTGYGPCYYGYSISRTYAHDVFSRIEEHGLLNEAIGKQFVEIILRPGGSVHPRELLAKFLGRPASSDTYTQWLEREAVKNKRGNHV
ncbi:MAG: oligopeptidase [Candidatus Dependentiae bacterium]|nr:oligopeptidase [Candidatus Dependentiae bacterium]